MSVQTKFQPIRFSRLAGYRQRIMNVLFYGYKTMKHFTLKCRFNLRYCALSLLQSFWKKKSFLSFIQQNEIIFTFLVMELWIFKMK